MTQPKITIVTICKNDLHGLMNTISSIGNLISDPIVQWIVVDGFSTDGTLDFLTTLQSKFAFKLIKSQKHIFGSMNEGLAVAKAPIVIFMNSGDTFYSEGVISQIIESQEIHKWHWAVGQANGVSADGKVLWNWPLPHHKDFRFKAGFRSFCHQSTIVQTALLREMGGYFEDSIFSDWGMSLLLSKKHKPFVHQEIWCNYLVGGVSSKVTAEFWAKENTKLRIALGIPLFGSKILDKASRPLFQYLYKRKFSKFR
jgi:glycosyltransferase involved in cell wall biosynthesis